MCESVQQKLGHTNIQGCKYVSESNFLLISKYVNCSWSGSSMFLFSYMIGLKIRSNVEKLKLVRNFIILRISKKLLSVIKGPVLTYYLGI